MKFQQELLRCQQQHCEEIKEKNQAITTTKETKRLPLRGKLEFRYRATLCIIFLIACSYDELWELLKPYCKKWYQLGIKFGADRKDLRSLIPDECGIPAEPQKCLELMLKMRYDKCEVTWLNAVKVLARQLAKPHS